MNTLKESERGLQARSLLENPIYREAIDGLREGIINKWRLTPIRDREGAHELKLMARLLTDIEVYIKQIADTGKMADIQLDRDTKISRLKEYGIR